MARVHLLTVLLLVLAGCSAAGTPDAPSAPTPTETPTPTPTPPPTPSGPWDNYTVAGCDRQPDIRGTAGHEDVEFYLCDRVDHPDGDITGMGLSKDWNGSNTSRIWVERGDPLYQQGVAYIVLHELGHARGHLHNDHSIMAPYDLAGGCELHPATRRLAGTFETFTINETASGCEQVRSGRFGVWPDHGVYTPDGGEG